MKKTTLLTLSLLMLGLLQAQVGINTINPLVSLHVDAFKIDGTTPEGIIAPRLTRAQLTAKDAQYTILHEGTFVYVTTIDGTASAKTVNVITVGYYYFDGTIWKHFNDKLQTADNGLSVTTSAKVQLGGDLIKNTKVDTKGHTLSIVGTGTATGVQLPTGASDGHVLTSDAQGNATWNAPGFSQFSLIPSAKCTYTTSAGGIYFDMVKKPDGKTYYIEFPSDGTYSITMGVKVDIGINTTPSSTEEVVYAIIQLLPADNIGLWGAASPRFAGSYEIYGVKGLNRGDVRFYLSENITVNSVTGRRAYLSLQIKASVSKVLTGNVYIGNGAGSPNQLTGGSFIKIN